MLERVAEPVEELAELVRGQQAEQHQDGRLLRELVAVRAVPFGLEDEVEALDVAVLAAVGVPVELGEVP